MMNGGIWTNDMNEFRAAFPAVVEILDDGKESVLRRWM